MKPSVILFLVGVWLVLAASVAAQDNDVPRLIEKLTRDEKAGQRRAAARALGELGPKAKAAVPTLIKALKDIDGSVRDEAEGALKKIGEPAVAELLEALKDPDEFVRLRVVGVLGGIGPDAKEAIPALEVARKDSSSFVRDAAEEALIRVRVDVKSLLALLKDKDEEKRLYAVRAAAFLGPHAKPLIPELCTLLKQEKSKEVRREVPKTFARLGKEGKGGLAAMAAALNDPDEIVRLNILQAFCEMGTEASAAAPAIARAGDAARRAKNEELYEAAVRAWHLVQGKKPSGK